MFLLVVLCYLFWPDDLWVYSALLRRTGHDLWLRVIVTFSVRSRLEDTQKWVFCVFFFSSLISFFLFFIFKLYIVLVFSWLLSYSFFSYDLCLHALPSCVFFLYYFSFLAIRIWIFILLLLLFFIHLILLCIWNRRRSRPEAAHTVPPSLRWAPQLPSVNFWSHDQFWPFPRF